MFRNILQKSIYRFPDGSKDPWNPPATSKLKVRDCKRNFKWPLSLNAKRTTFDLQRYPQNRCVFAKYRDMCVITYRNPLEFICKFKCALCSVHVDQVCAVQCACWSSVRCAVCMLIKCALCSVHVESRTLWTQVIRSLHRRSFDITLSVPVR